MVEGEHRAPWAMLVEGNGGISKRQLEFEEKERKKIGNFGKHASTSVSIAASSETLVQAEGGLRGGVSHCREGGLSPGGGGRERGGFARLSGTSRQHLGMRARASEVSPVRETHTVWPSLHYPGG